MKHQSEYQCKKREERKLQVSMSNAKHCLSQKVLQKYGWSATFDQTDEGCWYVDVTIGYNNTRRFVASDERPNMDKRDGTQVASAVALEGLAEEVEREEAKPIKYLCQVFPKQIPIKESNDENWDYFWTNKPTIVGIDTEGNQMSPPVLLQVATNEYVILEAPITAISPDVQRLLDDDSIVKVFCDNFSHRDKTSLGITLAPNRDYTFGSIVDLESIAMKKMGKVKVARGLSRILTLAMPNLNVQIGKSKRSSNVQRFCLIEQGKMPRLHSIWSLSQQELQYAALDAWATLQAHYKLQVDYDDSQRVSLLAVSTTS